MHITAFKHQITYFKNVFQLPHPPIRLDAEEEEELWGLWPQAMHEFTPRRLTNLYNKNLWKIKYLFANKLIH